MTITDITLLLAALAHLIDAVAQLVAALRGTSP